MRRGACVLGLILAATLASCGGGGESSTTSTGPATASSSLPSCHTSDLRVVALHGGAAAGHQQAPFLIRNVTGPRCTLYGFPRIAGIDASGHPVKRAVAPASSDFFGRVPKRLVVIASHGVASFRLASSSSATGATSCPPVSHAMVGFPPDPARQPLDGAGSICLRLTTVSPVAQGRSALSGG
jgi:Domain of unknown function (DUF4232)